MSHRSRARGALLLPLALGLALGLLAEPAAWAARPETSLDKAAACRRRAKPACVLKHADRVLELLGEAGAPGLRREALVLRAEALALLDRPEEAIAAFDLLLVVWPGWAPATDADPRVAAALDEARTRRVESALPSTLEPGPVPLPEPPGDQELQPPPVLYAPTELTSLDTEEAKQRKWRLSIGAGAAFVGQDVERRFDHGVAVAVDLGYQLHEIVGLWLQATLSLHAFNKNVLVEPGYGRGLTTAAIVIGVDVRIPIIEDLEIVAAAGLGPGFFGVRSLGDAIGFAFQGDVGLRYAIDDHLAVRLDAVPSVTVPIGSSAGPGGHIALFLRGESRF